MAKLTATLFRDFFGGSWSGKIYKNGEFQREIVFNWPVTGGNFSFLGTDEGLIVPPGGGILDNTKQVSIAGWRNDLGRWCDTWFNEFGGYGELQWTSQEKVNGITVIYGFVHESKQESDDPTEHVARCELIDQDNFKYIIQSFRKGLLEIVARRIRNADELKAIMEKQVIGVKSFSELAGFKNKLDLSSEQEPDISFKFNNNEISDTANN